MPRSSRPKKDCEDCRRHKKHVGHVYYALTMAKEEYFATLQTTTRAGREIVAAEGDRLPPRVIAFFKEQEKKCDCAICLESMENNRCDDLYMLSCCAHLLHNECAKNLSRGTEKVPCPFCRKEVTIYIRE